MEKIRIRDRKKIGCGIREKQPESATLLRRYYAVQQKYWYGTGTVPYPRVRASIRHAVWRAAQLSTQRRMSGAPGRAWKII